MNALTPLTISDISIRQDENGRYCLNDLHKAAGSEDKHRPTYWLKIQQTLDLQKELEIDGIPSILTKQGFGTFAVKELVYAYAMWISAKFHIAVIRAYDALATGQTEQQAKPTPTPKQNHRLEHRYHYPRKLLEQPQFRTETRPASLSIGMLGNTTEFVSPLFALLNQLRADGHDVSAPWDEAVAMREAIQRYNKVMEEVSLLMFCKRFEPASTSVNGI